MTDFFLTVGRAAPQPEAQPFLQNVTTQNTKQEKTKEFNLLKGEEKKLPLCVTHRPEGPDPPGTSNEAHLILLLSWDPSQPSKGLRELLLIRQWGFGGNSSQESNPSP